MHQPYKYKSLPLTPSIAEYIISVILGQDPMKREDIKNAVVEQHEKHGGLPARGNPLTVIKTALSNLKKSGKAESVHAGYWRMTETTVEDSVPNVYTTERLDRLEQSVGVLIAIYLNTSGPVDPTGYLKRGRHSQHLEKFKELGDEFDDVGKLIDLFLQKK